MYVNNETGVLQPIRQIGKLIEKINKDIAKSGKQQRIYFHTDAVQAAQFMELNVDYLHLDLMTLSAHKIYGPKGIGALYVGNNILLEKIIYGGAQELNRRPGTENVPAVAGFAAAVGQMDKNRSERKRIKDLRDYLERELKHRIPTVRINGEQGPRLFSHANIYFPFIDGDVLMMNLDMRGIAISVGSACSSGSIHPSHVLTAMGLDASRINRSVRFSLGRFTTRQQIEQTIATLVSLYQERSKGVS